MNQKKNENMKWDLTHELIVLILYIKIKTEWESKKKKDCSLKKYIEKDKNRFKQLLEICPRFTCTPESIKSKLLNICYLDTGEGLENASKLNKKVYNCYKEI